MPVNPISINKSNGSNASFRIEPGRVLEYEQHSRPILGIALQEKKNKWAVLNQSGAELELAADRLFLLPGTVPQSVTSRDDKKNFLCQLEAAAAELTAGLALEEVWEIFSGETKEVTVEQVAELAFGKESLESHLAVRRALLNDQVFFKRKKQGFEPRPAAVVEELKAKEAAEKEKQRKRELCIETILQALKGARVSLPEEINALEQTAAFGKGAPESKDAKLLLEEISSRTGTPLQGKLEDQAFDLLVAVKHFAADEDLNLIRLDRPVAFAPEAEEEAERLNSIAPASRGPGRIDLRGLCTVTIDGAETKDIDDALSLEETAQGFRVGIHITDAPALLEDSPVLKETALRRATSIYCADRMIPMLPPAASEQSLSLIEGQERAAVSFFVDFDRELNLTGRSLCRSLVTITKRFTYEAADALLCQETRNEEPFPAMLFRLWEIAAGSETRRLAAGALQFGRKELNAKIGSDGKIVLEDANEDTPAHRLVSEMMILANETAAFYAQDNGFPLIFRTQEPPDVELGEQGLDIPDGPAREYFRRGFIKRSVTSPSPGQHSGLGVAAYAQVTSPIRRAADLVNLAQVASFSEKGTIRFDQEEVARLIATLEPGLDEANQIQRERNRYFLLRYLRQEGIQDLSATLLRIDGIKPLAELDFIHSLYPFTPRKDRVPPAFRKDDLGSRIKLHIEQNEPRTLSLFLKEI